MAISHVGQNSGYDSGPITLAGVAPGNLLIVMISGMSALTTTSLPAGWQKLTPRANASGAGTAVYGCMWYYENHGGGNVIVAITNAPSDAGWSIHEVSGIATTSSFDEENYNLDGTTAFSTGQITTDQAEEYLFYGMCQETNSESISWDSPAIEATEQGSHVHS